MNLDLLKQLLTYAQTKKKPRCERYQEAVEDCISTLEKESFEHIRKRDLEFDEAVRLLRLKRKQAKRGSE